MSTDLHATPADHGIPSPPPPVGHAARRAASTVFGVVLVLAGLAAGLVLWTSQTTRTERSTTTHAAVDRVVLDLRANGDVEVTVHDRDEIRVEQTVETTMTEMEVDQTVVGDELRLASSRCQRWLALLVDRCTASFVVSVPPGTAVGGDVGHGAVRLAGLAGPADVRTGHGRIEVTDTTGDLDLRTGHGEVAVARAGGDVTVETGHGRVSLTGVDGRADATTGHGAIDVEGAHGALTATTGHGRIRATDTTGAEVWLNTGHGAIDFAPASPPRSAVVDTSHGAVSVALPPDAPPYAVTASAGGRSVDLGIATDPGADHRLEVTTGHGTIEVAYAR